jgi:hypothetical protein
MDEQHKSHSDLSFGVGVVLIQTVLEEYPARNRNRRKACDDDECIGDLSIQSTLQATKR